MQTKLDTNPINANRQLALRVWLYERGQTWRTLGDIMGITPEGAAKMMSRPRMPVARFNQLTAAMPALPRELLPEPRDVPPGPKPKFTPELTA